MYSYLSGLSNLKHLENMHKICCKFLINCIPTSDLLGKWAPTYKASSLLSLCLDVATADNLIRWNYGQGTHLSD